MIVAFIGFGEAGLAIAESLGQSTVATLSLRAFDIKLADENDGMAETMLARMSDAGVTPCDTAQGAVSGAGIVISVVTADQAANAAGSAASRSPRSIRARRRVSGVRIWCAMSSPIPRTSPTNCCRRSSIVLICAHNSPKLSG